MSARNPGDGFGMADQNTNDARATDGRGRGEFVRGRVTPKPEGRERPEEMTV